VLIAGNGASGLRLLAGNPVDVVILDYHMPDMDGLAVALAIRARYGRLPIVLLSGYSRFRRHCRRSSTPASARTRFRRCCWKRSGELRIGRRSLPKQILGPEKPGAGSGQPPRANPSRARCLRTRLATNGTDCRSDLPVKWIAWARSSAGRAMPF
jgi:hypothetical protein